MKVSYLKWIELEKKIAENDRKLKELTREIEKIKKDRQNRSH